MLMKKVVKCASAITDLSLSILCAATVAQSYVRKCQSNVAFVWLCWFFHQICIATKTDTLYTYL